MQKVVGVRFKTAGKIYYFDPLGIHLEKGDNVVVETARGLEYGSVSSGIKYLEEDEIIKELKPVIRKATGKDRKQHEKNLKKAEEALEICRKEVEKEGLDMKLIRAEYTFNASKVIFYFTADGRVDFRELVKKLAAIFRIRIELRQIGVRDESKILGGVGPCGCELCCNKWLGDFQPVSIKMAKEQGLSLNPSKISGICGRLLCCLQYESEFYEDAIGRLPKVGDRVTTEDGRGVVERVNVLKETALVKFDNDGDIAFREYSCADIGTKGCPRGAECASENCPKKREGANAASAASPKLRIVEEYDEEDRKNSGQSRKSQKKRRPRKKKKSQPSKDAQAQPSESASEKSTESGRKKNSQSRNSRKRRPSRKNQNRKNQGTGKPDASRQNASGENRGKNSQEKGGQKGGFSRNRRRRPRRNNRRKPANAGGTRPENSEKK